MRMLTLCLAAAALLTAVGLRPTPSLAGGGSNPCFGCFAVVKSDGTLLRANNVISSRRTAVGRYRVAFYAYHPTCALTATLMTTGATPGGPGSITLGLPTTNEVAIATYNKDGVLTDRGFSLVVTC